jgi:uncharacterized membrane protein
MKRSKSELVILALSLVGVALSVYALTLHFAPSDSSFCNISANWNCDRVNKSEWAQFLGIPVAVLGLLGYLAVFLGFLKRRALSKALSFTDADVLMYLRWLITVMFAFQIYLTGVEIFAIKAYCIVCLASQAIILAMFALAWRK